MLSSALSKFTFTNLSSQTSAIPQLIFSCSCFLGVVSSDVFNRGGQVCLACISDMKAGIRFFPFCFFLFSPFHCMLLFYLLIYFHPFIACFPLELCSCFLFFIYASLRLRFSLALPYQISLALMRQVSLALLRFLPVVLALHATCRFFLELRFVWKLRHLNFPQSKLWMKKCGFPMISWKLPHEDACCTLYSPASCKVAAYGLHDVAQ